MRKTTKMIGAGKGKNDAHVLCGWFFTGAFIKRDLWIEGKPR